MDNIIGRRVEWAEEDGKVATGFIANTCPKCGASNGNGHAEDCVDRK